MANGTGRYYKYAYATLPGGPPARLPVVPGFWTRFYDAVFPQPKALGQETGGAAKGEAINKAADPIRNFFKSLDGDSSSKSEENWTQYAIRIIKPLPLPAALRAWLLGWATLGGASGVDLYKIRTEWEAEERQRQTTTIRTSTGTKCGTQNGCNEACYKLGNSRYGSGKYRMNPRQSSCTNCTCNFVKCGTQNGCNEACYKLGNSRYGSGKYRMSPKQSSCTSCSCNFTKCGTQNGCNEACYKLGNSRYGSGKYRMNPKQSSCTNCSCNFVKCGTQSGCERACPSKSGYTRSPRQVNCTTCYCNYKKQFRCPYSGCGGTGSWSQCYLCRCRGICNNARCGGVRTVRSNGSCFCNKSC